MSTNTKAKFISPNELFTAAKNEYFGGDDPQTPNEWALVVNYWAANVAMAEESICLILKKIYDCPLSDNEVKAIARFQASNKLDRRSNK